MVTQNTLRRLVTALGLNKCLEQIRSPSSLHPCASFLELPSQQSYHGSGAALEKIKYRLNMIGKCHAYGTRTFMKIQNFCFKFVHIFYIQF